MSKSRFYDRAISALKEDGKRELAEDIESYVNSLNLERALLVDEVFHEGSFRGKELLRSLGFNTVA